MKHTILFLAANPSGMDALALDREARAIQVELERCGSRDSFELVTRWAAEPHDLLRELRKLKPTVVHFAGHGAGRAGRPAPDAVMRDIGSGGGSSSGGGSISGGGSSGGGGGPSGSGGARSEGLCFQGPDGRPRLVSTEALELTFGAAGASVRVIVLNACYSEGAAEALLAHVDCVVGMSGAIRDEAARSFASGFYGGLGEREPIAAAYRQGRAAISLEGLPDGERPQLRVRAGVDAGRLVLAAPPT